VPSLRVEKVADIHSGPQNGREGRRPQDFSQIVVPNARIHIPGATVDDGLTDALLVAIGLADGLSHDYTTEEAPFDLAQI
jgi:hypothetical protein